MRPILCFACYFLRVKRQILTRLQEMIRKMKVVLTSHQLTKKRKRCGYYWSTITLVLQRALIFLNIYLQVFSADNFRKQFGPRSGPTKCRAWSGSKLFDTLMVLEKLILKKVNQQTTKNCMQNYPVSKEFMKICNQFGWMIHLLAWLH